MASFLSILDVFWFTTMLFHFTKWTQHCDETHWLLMITPTKLLLVQPLSFPWIDSHIRSCAQSPSQITHGNQVPWTSHDFFYFLAVWGSIPLLFWIFFLDGMGFPATNECVNYLETLSCCHESPSLFEFCLLCDTACACSISTAEFHSFDVLLQIVITVLDTEQNSNRRPFSLLNDEQSNKVRVVDTNQR